MDKPFKAFTRQDFQCDKCQKEFYGTTFYSRKGSEITYCQGCYNFLKQGAAEVRIAKLIIKKKKYRIWKKNR